mmetsp:Transcript_107533/g.332103  ORF Transcript_107533/g.332103 Transcript_107533/m.332103 type:complete len:493 (-) Transcript_107533:112-1590(-)
MASSEEGRSGAQLEVQTDLPLDVPRRRAAEALDQVRLAAPVCLGLLCNRFVSTASTVLVGRQGATELAAVGLAVSLANVTGYSIIVGVATTLQTTAGQAFGARNFAEVSLSVQRCGLLCSLTLCVIAVVWFNAKSLLHMAGQEEAVSALAARYLALLFPGICCYVVTQCLQNWLAAQRVTSPSGTGGIINAIAYLPLCWTMMFPLGLGFDGAAVATSLSNVFLMSWMVVKTRHYLRTQLQHSWQGVSRLALTKWSPFLRLALPNFLMISEWWASEIVVLMAGVLPEAHLSLAALALMANTNSICFMAPLSLSIAANTRVSNDLGAGLPRKAKHAASTSCFLGLAVEAVTSSVVLIFHWWWARLFTSDASVLEHARPILQLSGVYVVADGMAAAMAGSLKGCGRHALLAPVVIAAYYAAGLPCSWFFAWPLSLNTMGLALGALVGTYVHCLSFAALLSTTNWSLMAQRAKARNAEPFLEACEAECDDPPQLGG